MQKRKSPDSTTAAPLCKRLVQPWWSGGCAMPSRKRKRGASKDEHSGSASFSFMLLPLEIRLKVYENCYMPHTALQESACETIKPTKTPRTNIISSKARERAFFANSRCSHPFLHQSLLFVCRQAHIDVWPFYMARHSLSFTRPIRFANDFLSFQTPRCLAMVKHLSLRAGDESLRFNPASKSDMRRMISDVERLFTYYPDVFLNLLSFTWEIRDDRYYCPNRWQNEKTMWDTVVSKLLKHNEEERSQGEASDMGILLRDSKNVAPGVQWKQWRTGVIARHRKLKAGPIELQHDDCSLVFFERLPSGDRRGAKPEKGLRYINLSTWLNETIPVPSAYSVRQHQSIARWAQPCDPGPTLSHTEIVRWVAGEIDCKSGTDVLAHAVLLDVGV